MGKGKKAMLEVSNGTVNLMTPNVIMTKVVRISTSRYAKEVSSHQ